MPDDHKTKVKIGNNEYDAIPVAVHQAQEQWNTYLLDDGSVLKSKLVVTKVLRVENLFDTEGNPVYSFQSTNVTTVDSPAHLRKK